MSETIFYSATRNSFYLSSLKDAYEASKKGWPNDAVEISEEEHSRLLAKQSEGKVLSPNKNGYPVLTDPPPPTHKQAVLAASDKQKTELGIATKKIAPLQDAVDLDMATDEEKAQLAAWKKYRVLLNRVDISSAPDIDWPETPDAEKTGD